MSKTVKVVVDAMGGDYAPSEPVKGSVLALKECENLEIILVGKQELIEKELSALSYDKGRLSVVNATEVIITGEPPVQSIQQKKDSSLVVGLKIVRNGEADAFVSAGNTGSVLVGGQVIVRKAKGVLRAPLAPLIPTAKGVSLLIDCGANVDARPEHLVQFATMGQAYMESMLGIEKPRVALVNIGAEEEKGNALVKETFPLLKESSEINFIGNIEARDIPSGYADVIVTEAFVGNVILKLYEGLASTLIKKIKEGMMSSTRGKIGGALAKPALKATLKDFDVDIYGGAPLLGLRGLVVKTHGNSKDTTFKNAIIQCIKFAESDLNGTINNRLGLPQ